jgi:hypothetical protein
MYVLGDFSSSYWCLEGHHPTTGGVCPALFGEEFQNSNLYDVIPLDRIKARIQEASGKRSTSYYDNSANI